MVYIDQPVGTGFSKGNISVSDEIDVANHYMGFVSTGPCFPWAEWWRQKTYFREGFPVLTFVKWKNFVDTFSIQGYKIYFAGFGAVHSIHIEFNAR